MAVPVEEQSESPRAPAWRQPDGPLTTRDGAEFIQPEIHEVCPYLRAAGGSWRSATPHREHRCGAVEPPASLTLDKQRRLCLSADHGGCPTFRAARASRAAMLAPGIDPAAVAAADAARRPIARGSALILERPRLSAPTARWPLDRAMSQAALVALMVVAFVAVAIARFSGPEASAVTQPTASPSATASPTARPTPRPTPSPSPSLAPSAGTSGAPPPSAAPSAAASGAVSGATGTPAASAPGFSTTYVVKKGDSLYGIAGHFGTSVAALKELNGLTDNSLHIGQELKIP
jgi:LysM repeat protein